MKRPTPSSNTRPATGMLPTTERAAASVMKPPVAETTVPARKRLLSRYDAGGTRSETSYVD